MRNSTTQLSMDTTQYAPLTVVSGFPRSGTSTMMRMIQAGGIEVLADKENMESKRRFNPYGDFELQGKRLARVRSWKPAFTAGKVIKIVTPFIRECCPVDRPIRVVFMTRDPNEIVTSLLAMRVVWEWLPAESVADARDFLNEHSIPVKYIKYTDLLTYPHSTAVEVAEWLGLDADIDAMAGVVDPEVRTRTEDGQLELLTYHFTKALVNDTHVVDLKVESNED